MYEQDDWVILRAKFRLKNQAGEIGKKKIMERMKYVKKTQNRSYPNAGSIFKKRSFLAGKLLNGLRIGDAQLKGNWIYNLGNASFDDVIWLIGLSKILSYLTIKKLELEIEIWK